MSSVRFFFTGAAPLGAETHEAVTKAYPWLQIGQVSFVEQGKKGEKKTLRCGVSLIKHSLLGLRKETASVALDVSSPHLPGNDSLFSKALTVSPQYRATE